MRSSRKCSKPSISLSRVPPRRNHGTPVCMHLYQQAIEHTAVADGVDIALLIRRRHPYVAPPTSGTGVSDVVRKACQGTSRYCKPGVTERTYSKRNVLQTPSKAALKGWHCKLRLKRPIWCLCPKRRHQLRLETSFHFVQNTAKCNTQGHDMTAFTTGPKFSTNLRDGVNACGLALPFQAKPTHIRPRPSLAHVIYHVRANAGYDLASQP